MTDKGDSAGDSAAESNVVVSTPREKPEAEEINELVDSAIDDAAAAGKFDELALCYNTRRMLWDGQSDDGRLGKLDKLPKDRKVFSWEGAPDTRVPYADEVVIEHLLLRNSALQRGEIKIGPREVDASDGSGDEDTAAAWQNVLDFWLDVSKASFNYQQRLFSSCVEEYGYAGVLVGARRMVRTDKRKVTLMQVLEALVQRKTQEVLAGAGLPPDAPLDPQYAAAIQQEAQTALELILSDAGDTQLRDLLMSLDALMPKTEARMAARELRQTRLDATYYVPTDDGYWPFTKALVPFVNWIHGADLTGDGQMWWSGIPEIMGESDLRARAAAEDWDDAFLEAVLEHPNEFVVDMQTYDGRVPKWTLSGAGVEQVLTATTGSSEADRFYQVVYVWRQLVGKDGLPMIYHTLVHHEVDDVVGFHECTGMATLPIHVETREEVLYAMQARGIPQIVVAGQNQMKDLMDCEGARTQLRSNPPLNRTADQHVPVRPGQQLYVKRDSRSEFMNVPGGDAATGDFMDRVRAVYDRRFFRHAETDHDMKRLYREMIALNAAESIRAVIRLLWKVMQGKIDNIKASRIAGRVVNLDVTRDSLQGEADVTVHFNVDSLNVEAADKFMDWVTKLSQADRSGAVDWTEVVNIAARMSNPQMAARIILPKEEAARRIADDQNNRIAQMSAGVPMRYEEKASAPEMRLQIMQQWMQTPMNLQRVQNDPVWAESMKNEMIYLQRQIQQYQENAVTGRTLMAAA